MKLQILSESGYDEALFGFGFSFGLTENMTFQEFLEDEQVYNRVKTTATANSGRMGGHDKFLRDITIHLDVTAPFFWLKQMDTYKVGTVCQSASTMHTLHKRTLTKDDFEHGEYIPADYLAYLNRYPNDNTKYALLPDGFLQRRLYTINYAVAGLILWKRLHHKLPQWQYFCETLRRQAQHPELLQGFVAKAEK